MASLSFNLILVFLTGLLLVTTQCTSNNSLTDFSRSLIMREVSEIEKQLQEIGSDYELRKTKFLYEKRTLAKKWTDMGKRDEALEMLNMAQIMTLIESIKYAVSSKTLVTTRHMLGGQFVPVENGMVDTQAGVVIPANLVPVLGARARARALIEADRQSEWHWYMLHKTIEHNLQAHKDKVFKRMAKDAYRALLDLRSKALKAHEIYYNTMKTSMKDILGPDANLSQMKQTVDGLDLLIETAAGCPSCHKRLPQAEYYSTRPLFDSEQAVDDAMSELIDQQFIDSFQMFDDEPSVYKLSVAEQNKVTRLQINELMQKVMSESSDKKKSHH